jgi:cell division protein FtsW
VGLANSGQKLAFLPESPTDFIFAVIGEEFGLIGTMLIAAVFMAYLFFGVKISLKAPDPGGFYLGLGITLMVVMPAFINMSTALAIVPAKGLTLPFISRGGSSLLVNLMATGILLNISSQKKNEE